MVETTKTKTRESIIDNSWVRDVLIPVVLIVLAVIILNAVRNTSLIPEMFKPFILTSGLLVIAAAILEALIIISKVIDWIVSKLLPNL